jgi:hypothetical protein
MLSGIFCRKQPNQRTAQTIRDDLSIIFYLRLEREPLWRRRPLETQRLAHKAEQFEFTIGTRAWRTNQIAWQWMS